MPSGAPLPGMRQFGMIAGVLGVVLGVAGYFMSGPDGQRFFQAYLVAYTFWMGVVLGCLALLMVQHLSGGVWGIVLRRPFEAAVRTMPFMAVLFIPIVFGMHSLYEWSHADIVANDPIMQQKALYLNMPFFYARQAFYFLVWGTIGHFLTSWSAEHDRTGDPALVAKLSKSIRRRPARLRADHDVRDGRLDDVGQPALVLDHLGDALRRRPGPVGVRVRHHRAVDAVADGAAQPGVDDGSLPRSRQAPVRVPDAVGVPVVLAVPDHLVGEHPRRDSALSRSLG